MTTVESLSLEEKEFLARCEEELKDRYTEKDEEFMKVHSAGPSTPPIIETWWVSQNSGRRNDRRFNRRYQAYDRPNRDNDRRSGYDHDYEKNRGGQGYRSHHRHNY